MDVGHRHRRLDDARKRRAVGELLERCVAPDRLDEMVVGHDQAGHTHAAARVLRDPPEIRAHPLELHPTVLLDYPVAGDVERRLVQAIPATATSTPTTLASCGTRIEPSQKLSSRSASMAKRPTE